jgi:co-chaperonin GroES (HSP10)
MTLDIQEVVERRSLQSVSQFRLWRFKSFKPLSDWMLIRPTLLPSQTGVTGRKVVLPESVIKKLEQAEPLPGVVVEVGQGRMLVGGGYDPPPVKPGDWVAYNPSCPHEIEVGGERLVLLKEGDLIGRIEIEKEDAT